MREIASILLLCAAIPIRAQQTPAMAATASIHDRASLRITLVLVPELQACKPSGYASGDDRNHCLPLRTSTIDAWLDDGRPQMPTTIDTVTRTLTLSRRFAAKLDAIVHCNAPVARHRWAVVIRFEGGPPGAVGTIERDAVNDDPNCPINEYHYDLEFQSSGIAINHERADAFFPSLGDTWTVVVAEHTYRFRIRGE